MLSLVMFKGGGGECVPQSTPSHTTHSHAIVCLIDPVIILHLAEGTYVQNVDERLVLLLRRRVSATTTHRHAHTYAHARTHTHAHAHAHTHTHVRVHSAANLFAIRLVVVKSVLAMMDSLGTSVREGRDVTTGCHALSLVG